jgi:hypothetical protein
MDSSFRMVKIPETLSSDSNHSLTQEALRKYLNTLDTMKNSEDVSISNSVKETRTSACSTCVLQMNLTILITQHSRPAQSGSKQISKKGGPDLSSKM